MEPSRIAREGGVAGCLARNRAAATRPGGDRDVAVQLLVFELLAAQGRFAEAEAWAARVSWAVAARVAPNPGVNATRLARLARSEALRAAVLDGDADDELRVLGADADDPAIKALRRAWEAVRAGDLDRADAFARESAATRPRRVARVGPLRADGLADADPLFGPILEVFADDRYFWIPWHAIASLSVAPPTRLHDTIWPAARVVLRDGNVGEVALPNYYPATFARGDDWQRLGLRSRPAERIEPGAEGYGPKSLASADGQWRGRLDAARSIRIETDPNDD